MAQLDLGGRCLSYEELGDASGVPCVYLHGTPSCSAEARHLDAAAREVGVRLVAPDRPGFGGSDPLPGRRVADFASDVAALARSLGLRSYLVIGVSGGGPYALACAALLPQVRATALVAALVPQELPGVRDALPADLLGAFELARSDPAALEAHYATVLSAPVAPVSDAPPGSDAEVLSRPEAAEVFEAMRAGGVRQGYRAAVQEMQAFAGDWGYAATDVRGPVRVWAGVDDPQLPPDVARAVAAALPCATCTVVEGGHLFAVDRGADVLRDLVAAAGQVSGHASTGPVRGVARAPKCR
jgi:pimeloyl-ACP methyl ester carboxylesterase